MSGDSGSGRVELVEPLEEENVHAHTAASSVANRYPAAV